MSDFETLAKRLVEVERVAAEARAQGRGRDGRAGPPGPPGRDGTPASAEQVAEIVRRDRVQAKFLAGWINRSLDAL